MRRIISLGLAIIATTACDRSTSSDPATATRNDLNPPSGLVTVTGDKQIELRWQAMNAEEDFKGYRVFAVAKALSELSQPSYPEGFSLDKLKKGSIPRCDKNSTLFESFGFPAIEAGKKECEGDEASDSGTSSKSLALIADSTSTDTAQSSKSDDSDSLPPQVVKCADRDNKDLSTTHLSLKPATTPTLTEQVCVVSALADGTALSNGTTYTFFVAAINADDDFEKVKLSWTSNFVEDTPAKALFTGTVTLAQNKMQFIPLTALQAKSITALESTDCDAGKKGCFVYNNNTLSTKGIYFGRIESSSYPQRSFISATASDELKLLLRGPQTADPLRAGTIAESIPEDEAINASATDAYDDKGRPQPVYGNQVFDYQIKISDKIHYGKIVIKDVKLADPTKADSEVSYDIKVILQEDPENTHYFN